MTETILSGLLVLLVGAAVLGNAGKQEFVQLGDRVAAGMIASCLLLSFMAHSNPNLDPVFAIASSLPLIFYSSVLALECKSSFTYSVLFGFLIIYCSIAGLFYFGHI
jgi:hypothetical protein